MIVNYTARLINISNVSSNMVIYSFRFITPSLLKFKDGQYLKVNVAEKIGRSYSIFSTNSDSKQEFDILLALSPNGIGVNYFKSLKIGDIIHGKGPLGMFVMPNNPNKNLVFICTGSGFAPINSMIKGLIANGLHKSHNIFLYFGAKIHEDIVYHTEYDSLAKIGVIKKYVKCISQDITCGIEKINNNIFEGRVTEPVKNHINEYGIEDTDFFLCGNGEMINDMLLLLKNAGVNENNIHHEKFY